MAKSGVLGLMACDGVGVQWQNGDLCGASLALAVLCGNPPPFCGTLKFFALALLVCEFEDRRALCKNRKHKHKHAYRDQNTDLKTTQNGYFHELNFINELEAGERSSKVVHGGK